jgi:Fic family protein
MGRPQRWQWAAAVSGGEFSRKDAITALGFPARTVEAIIKKLLDMKKLQRLAAGRATRYRVLP